MEGAIEQIEFEVHPITLTYASAPATIAQGDEMDIAIHVLLAVLLFFLVNWVGHYSVGFGYYQLATLADAEDEAPAFNVVMRIAAPLVFIMIVPTSRPTATCQSPSQMRLRGGSRVSMEPRPMLGMLVAPGPISSGPDGGMAQYARLMERTHLP